MMRYDTRYRRIQSPPQPLTLEGDYTFFDPFPLSNECGQEFKRLVSGYSRRYTPRFAAIGKPLKYVLLIVGIDAENPNFAGGAQNQSRALTLSRNAADGYVWPNNDNRPSTQPVVFRPAGTAVCKAYFAGASGVTGAFESMRQSLDAASLPRPVMLICDFETRGDVPGWGPYGLSNQGADFPTPDNGVVELAPGTSQLTRTQTLNAWRAARNKTQDDAALNPLAPLVTTSRVGGRYDPVNWEALHLGASIVTANVADALAEAFFEPFQSIFGSDALCGEWDFCCATQEHQAPSLPTKRLHMLGSDLPIGLQIPKNYCDLPAARYNVDPFLFAQNPAWESVWNWLQAYQPAGYTPWTTYPTGPAPDGASDMVQRVVLESQTQVARACARAAPDKPLMPSISVAWRQSPLEPAGTDVQRMVASTPYLVRYMLNCCQEGASMFYLFAPGWNEGGDAQFDDDGNMTLTPVPASVIREANYNLVRLFNAEFQARVPYRNRVCRNLA